MGCRKRVSNDDLAQEIHDCGIPQKTSLCDYPSWPTVTNRSERYFNSCCHQCITRSAQYVENSSMNKNKFEIERFPSETSALALMTVWECPLPRSSISSPFLDPRYDDQFCGHWLAAQKATNVIISPAVSCWTKVDSLSSLFIAAMTQIHFCDLVWSEPHKSSRKPLSNHNRLKKKHSVYVISYPCK